MNWRLHATEVLPPMGSVPYIDRFQRGEILTTWSDIVDKRGAAATPTQLHMLLEGHLHAM